MEQSELNVDIALKIASYLEVLDVCALGSCSRFWRELCKSNCVWEALARERWPFLSDPSSLDPSAEQWREVYIKMHRKMAGKATALVEFVDPSESLEVGDYNNAIEDLCSMQFAFRDVQMFLFKPKLNVLLNLAGLHYSIFCLKVPVEHVMNALLSCKISERQVCVKWWKLGRWFYGFRMRDESHSHRVSLEDLLMEKGEEILKVLRRGAVHDVFRVKISIPNTPSDPWSRHSL